MSAIVLTASFALAMWAVYLMVKCMKKTYDCSYGLDVPDVKISINKDTSREQLLNKLERQI